MGEKTIIRKDKTMIMVSFRSRKDKEHLLEKAKKMKEYASMIVECIEDSKSEDYDYDYDERSYRGHEEDMEEMNDRMMDRYGYRGMRRR
jgi:hypothetical protein